MTLVEKILGLEKKKKKKYNFSTTGCLLHLAWLLFLPQYAVITLYNINE